MPLAIDAQNLSTLHSPAPPHTEARPLASLPTRLAVSCADGSVAVLAIHRSEAGGGEGEGEHEGEGNQGVTRVAGQMHSVARGGVRARRGGCQSGCGDSSAGRMGAGQGPPFQEGEAMEGEEGGARAVWGMRVEHHWQAHAFEAWSCCFDRWREQVREGVDGDGRVSAP